MSRRDSEPDEALATNILVFSRLLKRAGLPVSPQQNLTFAEALTWIERGVVADEVDSRPLHVLRGDILFGAGDLDDACTAYSDAARIASSPWVTAQLERCEGAAS